MEAWNTPEMLSHARLLVKNYRYWTSKELLTEDQTDSELAQQLYHAPFVMVSHDSQYDPVFNYGNLTAQRLWEMDWQAFTNIPSRLSAEPIEVERRHQLLLEGRNKGITYLDKAIRISRSGKRFYIKDVILFNLLDAQQQYLGQGAVYNDWEFI